MIKKSNGKIPYPSWTSLSAFSLSHFYCLPTSSLFPPFINLTYLLNYVSSFIPIYQWKVIPPLKQDSHRITNSCNHDRSFPSSSLISLRCTNWISSHRKNWASAKLNFWVFFLLLFLILFSSSFSYPHIFISVLLLTVFF